MIAAAFDAAATLATALRGLAEQTHADLEVLVVDDASTDGSRRFAADFARGDPRFRLIRQADEPAAATPRATGRWPRRRGEFVTVHDADDWSHPEKIALQPPICAARGAPFNFSAWVRTTPGPDLLGAARRPVRT